MKSRLRREIHRQRFSNSSNWELSWEQELPQIKILSDDPSAVKMLKNSTGDDAYQLGELGPEWFLDRIQSGFFDEIPKKDRLKLATLWYREAIAEKNSAEQLGVLSQQLVAQGAPLPVLKSAARMFLEEIEHARFAFSLSKSLLGDEPVAFRPRVGDTNDFTEAQGMDAKSELDDSFDLAWESLRGVLVQEMSSRFSLQLSRGKDFSANASELLKKSCDERRHSDFHWDVFSWSLKKGGREFALRLWAKWTHSTKPRFAENLLGDGKVRDLFRETRDEITERLQKYFELEWKLCVGDSDRDGQRENAQSERPLPISRPAS